MSQIDKIKESLNTLRILLSLLVGLVAALTSAVSGYYDQGDFGVRFYLALALINLMAVAIAVIFRKIRKRTDELEEL